MTVQTFLDGRVVLHCGDCLDVLAALPESSVDSVACDPPYHLVSIVKRFGAKNAAKAKVGKTGAYARASSGFMGKQWDGGDIAFRVELWEQVLRVLKPGGHLVAFSGTRTYHRMACAIEDAGFEIRDQIQWLYGAGFPKSHNVSRNIGDSRCACEGYETPGVLLQRDVRSMRDAHVSEARRSGDECGEVLHEGVSEQGASEAVSRSEPEKGALRRTKRGVEGRRNVSQPARQLRERAVCEMPAGPDFDGTQGRLRDGASSSDGAVDRATADADGVRTSHRSQTAEQPSGELGIVAGQPDAQAGGAWPRCERCGKPIIPDGLGSALKPANEPICLARKPLIGTLVENVLMHGTGAMNIDGCRVETAEDLNGGRYSDNKQGHDGSTYGVGINLRSKSEYAQPLGRWPANIILSWPEDEYELRRHVTPAEKSELYRWLSENP